MRLILLLVVGFALAAQDANTEYFHVMGGFLKGSDYLELNAEQRSAYATGFINGMSVAALVMRVNDGGEPKWLASCVSEMTDI